MEMPVEQNLRLDSTPIWRKYYRSSDLMLQLIDSYEVDIFDVKLSLVTNDFIKAMQDLVLRSKRNHPFLTTSRLLYYNPDYYFQIKHDEDEELIDCLEIW